VLIKTQLQQSTFAEMAVKVHNIKKHEFKNVRHCNQWLSSLKAYAFPTIGKMPVDSVEPAHIEHILEEIWITKTETVTRVRQRMAAVFDYALAKGARTLSNPANWKGCMEFLLPEPTKVKEGAARALELAILWAMRSGEVRALTWAEVDLDRKLITIPEEKMKNEREHVIPLSTAAIGALKRTKTQKNKLKIPSDYVFPNRKDTL